MIRAASLPAVLQPRGRGVILEGYPTAWLVDAAGTRVDQQSINEAGVPPPTLVVLHPGGKASTTVWYDNPGVPYPPCSTTTVTAIRVVSPGQSASVTVHMEFPVCRAPGPVVGTTPVTLGPTESPF